MFVITHEREWYQSKTLGKLKSWLQFSDYYNALHHVEINIMFNRFIQAQNNVN